MSEIVIYSTSDAQTVIEVEFDGETVWLSQAQIAALFQQTKQNISLHISNCFKEGELEKIATVKESLTVQMEGGRNIERKIIYYNLDVIISVGYRVKSKQGTQFRQWATQQLKTYLVQGYLLNEKRLAEANEKYEDLQKAVKLVARVGNNEHLSSTESQGILGVLEQYAYALELLDQYDHQKLSVATAPTEQTALETKKLTYQEAIQQIQIWRDFQKAGNLFGNEKYQSFRSSLETIYQTFDGIDLYPTIEEKASNLLYFIVKNHSFSDGNKRIDAGFFIYFLNINKKLFNNLGAKRIADNALVAITIMIAESKADEKDTMIKLVVNLINSNN